MPPGVVQSGTFFTTRINTTGYSAGSGAAVRFAIITTASKIVLPYSVGVPGSSGGYRTTPNISDKNYKLGSDGGDSWIRLDEDTVIIAGGGLRGTSSPGQGGSVSQSQNSPSFVIYEKYDGNAGTKNSGGPAVSVQGLDGIYAYGQGGSINARDGFPGGSGAVVIEWQSAY